MRLRDFTSNHFYEGLPTLAVLAFFTMVMILVSSFTEMALGLLAFSLLMWVTKPWAFADMIDKRLEKIKDSQPSTPEQALKRPRKWLDGATTGFLGSGVFFLITVIFQSFVEFAPPPNPDAISYIFLGTFAISSTSLAYSMLKAHQVVSFILHPEDLRNISTYGRQAAIFTRGIALIFVLVGWLIDIAIAAITYTSGVVSQILASGNLIGFGIWVAFVVGAAGVFPTAWSARRSKVDRWDLVGPTMTALPYALLLGITVVRSLGL